jgi:O-acetylhomoserine/O-acetylserine sulfhydrylase-like pyridoxal-dependent enzyme
MRPESKAIRIQTERSNEGEHSTPLFLTSSFVFDDAEHMRATFADENDDNIYSRFSNPNVQEFVDKMCALEGTEAGYATASGMSAVFASFMAFLKAGDHLLSCSSIFGSTHTVISKYLPKWGIEYSYADINKPETWEALITKKTKMIFVETPTNPGLDIVDLEWLGQLAKKLCNACIVATREIWCRYYHTLRYKIHRRTGPCARRLCARKKRTDQRSLSPVQKYRAGFVALQRVDSFEEPGDVACSHGASF